MKLRGNRGVGTSREAPARSSFRPGVFAFVFFQPGSYLTPGEQEESLYLRRSIDRPAFFLARSSPRRPDVDLEWFSLVGVGPRNADNGKWNERKCRERGEGLSRCATMSRWVENVPPQGETGCWMFALAYPEALLNSRGAVILPLW